MTVKELKQYQSLKEEIQDIEAEISELKNIKVTDVVKASYSDFPYTEHSVKVYGNDEHVLDLIAEKRQKKAELEQLKYDIERFIDNIPDSQTRRIIRYKYIRGCSWAEVAKRIGGNNTRESVRKMSRRFLEKN